VATVPDAGGDGVTASRPSPALSPVGLVYVDTPACAAAAAPLVRSLPDSDRVPRRSYGEGAAPGGVVALPPDALVPVADHLDLSLRGPLFGRWPASRRRTFPSMTGLYVPGQAEELLRVACPSAGASSGAPSTSPREAGERHPEAASAPHRPAVYSPSVVAGVVDPLRLNAWEREQARAAGLDWASGSLASAAVVAAYYGLAVAAVGVSSGPQP